MVLQELAVMKQILINLQDKHKEQNSPPSQINLKSLTAENKLHPSVKLLPEYEEENVFRPKPTLFVSSLLRVSAINFLITFLTLEKEERWFTLQGGTYFIPHNICNFVWLWSILRRQIAVCDVIYMFGSSCI